MRDGQLYWYGEQYLAYYPENEDETLPVARAKVQVHNSKEGTTSDDSEFRNGGAHDGDDENGGSARLMRIGRLINMISDIFGDTDMASTLTVASAIGSAALTLSMLQF